MKTTGFRRQHESREFHKIFNLDCFFRSGFDSFVFFTAKAGGFMMKGKRGELTTKQLVTIIVLIVSFIIVLFLLFQLNLGETTDEEICRNSVFLKSQSKLTSGPLDCRTSYVCVSGGEECETITATSEIEIDSDDRNEVLGAIANETVSCWFQFGEGEVNYGEGFTSTGVHCAICSIIEFDAKTQEAIPSISYSEFYNFLQTNGKDRTQSLLNYLYGVNDAGLVQIQPQFDIDISSDEIITSERYSVITGVDNNLGAFGLRKDEILKVYLVPTAETSTKTECTDFVTKA